MLRQFNLPAPAPLLALSLFLPTANSQTPPPNLKPLEGCYEYFNGLTIQFAQSPRDGILYAILDEALYPLKSAGPNTFTDRQGSSITFERTPTGEISDYRLAEKNATNTFRRISGANFPETMWYARRSNTNAPYRFHYSPPPDLKDGLQVSSLDAAGLDRPVINTLIEQIASEHYRNVHSILL